MHRQYAYLNHFDNSISVKNMNNMISEIGDFCSKSKLTFCTEINSTKTFNIKHYKNKKIKNLILQKNNICLKFHPQ